MSEQEKLPEIVSEYTSTFKRIIVSGLYGNISPLGIEATIYSEFNIGEEAIKSINIDTMNLRLKRMIECDLIINPLQMVAIRDWLSLKIKEYESVFGEIPSKEDLQDRLENLKKS